MCPKPLASCSMPGCPNLTRGHGLCPTHEHARQLAIDQRRPTTTHRGYGSAWQRERATLLDAYPHCRNCGAPASVIDHITPRALGGTDEPENLQSLCTTCHGMKTMRQSVKPDQRPSQGV